MTRSTLEFPWLPVGLAVLLTFASFGWVNQNRDFQFHFWQPKGVCPPGYEQSYCDGYYVVDKLFNFTSDPFWFLAVFVALFCVALPLAVGKSFWEHAAFFAFGFTYNVLFSSVYTQGLGLFVLLAYVRGYKLPAILLSPLVHAWLFYLLVTTEVFVRLASYPPIAGHLARAHAFVSKRLASYLNRA